jgi:CheY-like chemotaxis protein
VPGPLRRGPLGSRATLEVDATGADNSDVARILVIDDDIDMCRAVRLILESKGHLVTLSDDGHRGWATARRQRPDLIVLDIMMPVMDGYGVLEILRGDERTKHIPCVIISALRASEAEERARSLGAVGYVEKPFDWDDLIDTIEGALVAVA